MSAKKVYNMQKFTYFSLTPERLYREDQDLAGNRVIRENLGETNFRTYTDRTNFLGRGSGLAVQYVIGKDDRGKDRGKFFTLSQHANAFKVNEADTDLYGTTMYDFLLGYPGCEDSPNGTYIDDGKGNVTQLNVEYRIMNSDADAEVALDATTNKITAQHSAITIDLDTLADMAIIGIGVHGQPNQVMRHKVVEWAGMRPNDYLSILNANDRPIRALVRKAEATGTFVRKGDIYYWGNQLLGSSEDAAIKFILDNPDQKARLIEVLDMKAITPTVSVAPKKPGPKKNAAR